MKRLWAVAVVVALAGCKTKAQKQAEIKDPSAGTFAQLVTAAERCPVSAIHPGTPRNPKEKDLAKWLKRAEPFN